VIADFSYSQKLGLSHKIPAKQLSVSVGIVRYNAKSPQTGLTYPTTSCEKATECHDLKQDRVISLLTH
jgi:hypothetical protein